MNDEHYQGQPAKCSCGAPSHWIWYKDDEDIANDGWMIANCWRCHEIIMMKAQLTLSYLSGDGTLNEAQSQRFVDLLFDDSILLARKDIRLYPFGKPKWWELKKWPGYIRRVIHCKWENFKTRRGWY